MKNILVPVDFSDLSLDLIDMAAKLAIAFKSKIRIVHVASTQPYIAGMEIGNEVIYDHSAEEKERMEADLKALELYLSEKGIEADSVLLHGKIVNSIVEQSEKTDADLIVIGSNNYGILYRTLLGSVSEGVLHKTSCPVLICSDPSRNQ
jgi:nucleotide-binding universal stress UspA family protein